MGFRTGFGGNSKSSLLPFMLVCQDSELSPQWSLKPFAVHSVHRHEYVHRDCCNTNRTHSCATVTKVTAQKANVDSERFTT